jgi:phage terminase Nu1 subunit (DNA packaging protein)
MESQNLVPINNVAEKLGVSIQAVRGWVRRGAIPAGTYIKVGNTYRFDLKAVVSLMLDRQQAQEPEPKEVVQRQKSQNRLTSVENTLDIDL